MIIILNEINNIEAPINTLVFDFDNRARLFEPNKLNKSTICVNNNLFNKIQFINKIVDKYKNTKESVESIENILLINAWGENMTIEPSEQDGFFNLNLIYTYLHH